MIACEIEGCTDLAGYWVAFKSELGTYEICESCVEFWATEEPENVTIKPFANNLKPFYFDKAAAK
jgi:hypothetical protein